MKRLSVVVTLAAPLLLGGCINTYLDRKADLRAGGPQQRVAAAERELQVANTRHDDLKDKLEGLNRDVERMELALKHDQDSLRQLRTDLGKARTQNKINDAEYRRLTAEADKLQRDIEKLDFEMQGQPPASTAELEAKRRQLEELRKRKAELEATIRITGGS